MVAQGIDEPVLARAVELYAEGMSLEEANEPQLALDRYRRAVRMADERKIVARLQNLSHAATAHGPDAVAHSDSGAGKSSVVSSIPAATAAANEEDFQLWQALHMSRLEAEVHSSQSQPDADEPGQVSVGAAAAAGARSSLSAPVGEAPAVETASSGSRLRFAPPKRKQHRSRDHPGTNQMEARMDADEDQDLEQADRVALRAVQGRLRGQEKHGAEASASLVSALSASSAIAGAARTPHGQQGSGAILRQPSGEDEDGDGETFLTRILPEVLPDVFAFLDPYGLDRVARMCGSLFHLSRSTATWGFFGRRLLSVAQRRAVQHQQGTECWRRLLLLAPRLRTDGVYIAPCGYRRRVQAGASLNDSRESMHIKYSRLLRLLPKACAEDTDQQVMILTYEGELGLAVDALKTHPAGAEATFSRGSTACADASGPVRKLHDRVLLGVCHLDVSSMVALVRYTDACNEYLMEFKLLNTGKSGSRQNCRLSWVRYEFTSLKIPQDGGTYNLQKEQHYSPYTFARVRSLEHVW